MLMNTEKTYGIEDEIWYDILCNRGGEEILKEEKIILFLIFYQRLTTVNIAISRI